jgi:hypothetical protein
MTDTEQNLQTGRVLFRDNAKKFGKILTDQGTIVWFFEKDFDGGVAPEEVRTDARVRFRMIRYVQKRQDRTKAVGVEVIPELGPVTPALKVIGPDSVIAVRAARKRAPAPGAEVLAKLANVEAPKKCYRL